MVNKILVLLAILLLSSCSCDWHLARVQKKCGSSALVDTLIVHDTVKVDLVKKDTVFHYLQKDTVIVREGRLTMKYFYNNHDSTVYLNGKCDTVFITKEIKSPFTKYNIVVDYWKKYKLYLFIVIFGIILVLINKALK